MPLIVGQRYGRLRVLAAAPRRGHNPAWFCRCDCGTATVAIASNLRGGNTQSCGCYHAEVTSAVKTIHGRCKSTEYTSHQAMMARCYSSANIGFRLYGGRGIVVCDRWRLGEDGKSGFQCFLADMGQKPTARHSLDRINVNGNYQPDNCRWATPYDQARNTRRNTWVEFRGHRMILADAIRLSGLNRTLVMQRLARGWAMEAALNRAVA